MAKAPTTLTDPKKTIDYSEENTSETEEYFQNSSPTKSNSKKSSSNNSFEF